MAVENKLTVRNQFDGKIYIITTVVGEGHYGEFWTIEVMPETAIEGQQPPLVCNVITEEDGNIIAGLRTGSVYIPQRWPYLDPKSFTLLIAALVQSFKHDEWHTFFDQFQPPR